MSDLVNIGKFVATSGLKGELVLKHSLGKKNTFKNIEALFVEDTAGSQLPYFIKEGKAKNNEESFVKLDGVNTRDDARKLVQKQLWLEETEFRKLAAKGSPIGLLGYTIFNEGEELGVVEEVIEQPHQTLLRTTIQNREVYIPLHEETLEKISNKKQQVHVILPYGLLDVYQ
ncbi:MAG TPA: ribosome maturation factor RimM [Chitinophagaceae bacterium]|nr:ribosome maturation factor RimM [Chitinophagaceae bacterium]